MVMSDGHERDVDLEAGTVDQDITGEAADRQTGQPGPQKPSQRNQQTGGDQ